MRLSVCLFVCGPLAPSQSATSVGHNGSVPWCRGAVVVVVVCVVCVVEVVGGVVGAGIV